MRFPLLAVRVVTDLRLGLATGLDQERKKTGQELSHTFIVTTRAAEHKLCILRAYARRALRYNRNTVKTSAEKTVTGVADAELIDRCLKGDQAAWEALIRRYQNLIYSVPVRYRFSVQDASDIFQSVCVVLLEKLKTLRNAETLSSWLYITTKRQCWKLSKRKAMEVELDDAAGGTVDPEGEQLILQHQVRLGMDQLSEKCRDLLNALYYADPPMSYEEVTAKLGIPFGSIGPTRARCLERLRKAMSGEKP